MDSLPPSSSSSSSSSSPPSDNSLTSSKNCHICSQPAHGNHFGAISCRPCSAFFRRAIIGNYEILKCRQWHGKCEAKPNGRFNCKKCRLRKCYNAGMSVDKLQFDRDLVSSTEQFVGKRKMLSNIPHSPENFLGRPSFIFSCEPDRASSDRTLLDVQFMIDQAAQFLMSNTKLNTNEQLTGMNTLDQLSYALILSRVPSTENPIVCSKLGKDEYLMFWRYKMMAAAKWLTYCDEFQQLPQEMKLEFLKSVWYVWVKIEKIAKAAEKRMKSDEIDPIYHVINNAYIDMENYEIDTSWMSNYNREQLGYFLETPNRLYQNNMVDLLIDLRASSQEITYMVCVVSFRYAAKQNPGPIAELTEKLIDKLANDLHSYYFNELQLRNYVPRLAKLMKVVQCVERDIYERKQRAEIAKIFDIFSFEFSHPEMFIGI